MIEICYDLFVFVKYDSFLTSASVCESYRLRKFVLREEAMYESVGFLEYSTSLTNRRYLTRLTYKKALKFLLLEGLKLFMNE